MSSVMRPSGPLPPRVYWTRRLFLLLVLVLAVSMLWWGVQKVTGSADETTPAAGGGPTSAAPDPDAQTASADDDTSDPDPTTQVRDKRKDRGKGKKHERKVPLQPTGPCEVSDVKMQIDANDVKQGRANPIRLLLSGPADTACTQAVTANTMVVRITSGDDVIWRSDDCPDKLLAAEVVVRDDPVGVYHFNWNGRRSTGSCAGTGDLVDAGGYWVEAAFIGADAERAYFDVTP